MDVKDKGIARPFITWVGGKRSIINQLLIRLPKEYSCYHEPFLGGGALFFSIRPEKAYLSDINQYLIITYKAVRDNIEELINQLKTHEQNHNLIYFKKARMQLTSEQDSVKVASLFIYLNKTCYRGLYRVNKQGLFNSPMWRNISGHALDENNLRLCSLCLKNIDICDYSFVQIKPEKNHFYYLDPPYHKTYNRYDSLGFGNDDHMNLSELCRSIDEIGGYFMLSNSDTDLIRKLYSGYNIETITSSKNTSLKEKTKQNELIIRNY